MSTQPASRTTRIDFDETLQRIGHSQLDRATSHTLQVNVGKLCNQACLHCHVDAGPQRTEIMSADVVDRLIELMRKTSSLQVLDLTGGAPELNPEFRRLVGVARSLGVHVIDRCNLTVLHEPGQDDLGRFLAEHRVEVVASLPCYGPVNVDKQRGKGVFGKSVDGLLMLNGLGYGKPDSGLMLNLVYNPLGPSLPPPQRQLEIQYKKVLGESFGIVFNQLFTITNMPISRFLHVLRREGDLSAYMELLVNAFNPHTIDGLMCRHLVSVDWRGHLYDCDFNQMLELPVPHPERDTIWSVDGLDDLVGERIATAQHCFGCTAGAGSSCGGALE